MPALSDHPMNPVNTNEVLGFFKNHLKKVAEHQYILEHLTNNIFANLMN